LIPKSTVQNVVPEVNGNILIGATREEGVFDQQITIKGIREMAEAAITIFPKLWDAEFVSARAGIRPGSPDGKPILGPITELDGLSVATGHDWAGIMLSPETGRLMAEYISTGDPKPLQPFNPNRFDNKIVEAIARPLFWNNKQDYQS
jgi:glycine oxidase